MAWNADRSKARIVGHITTAPAFDERISLAEHSRLSKIAVASGLMDQVSPRRAFIVEGAHLYGQLLDFDTIVSEGGTGETEASHRRLLSFLNMHYKIWDSIVDGDDADRVD